MGRQVNPITRAARCLTLLVVSAACVGLPGRPLFAQPVSPVYGNITDAFTAGIQQHKFVMIFFRESADASHPNADLMAPVIESIAREPLIEHHAVFGDVDLAKDSVGLGVAKAMNASCKEAVCGPPVNVPTVSLFLPDSANISEIARLVGYQHDYAVRDLIAQRMCQYAQRHDPHVQAMDDELESACRGLADSRPSSEGWLRVTPTGGAFSVDLQGIPGSSPA